MTKARGSQRPSSFSTRPNHIRFLLMLDYVERVKKIIILFTNSSAFQCYFTLFTAHHFQFKMGNRGYYTGIIKII